MDIIVRVPHEALEDLGVVPGSMNLVDFEQQEAAIGAGSVARRLPGGSCANTVRGVRWLLGVRGSGMTPLYTGAVGGDRNGDAFEALLDTEGVKPILPRKHTPTGSSVILVTPDSQRTMFTYLGACRDLQAEDIDLEQVRHARIFHTTGYMWDTPNQEQAIRETVRHVRGPAGAARTGRPLISLDIADSFVVERYRDSLLEWIPGNIDLLFANEEELRSLTGVDDDDETVLAAAAGFAPTVVMKVGARGSIVLHDGELLPAEPFPAERVDTTGAGDAFAAGFLYGMLVKLELSACARLGNTVAGGIVSVDGCNYDALDERTLRPALQQAISGP